MEDASPAESTPAQCDDASPTDQWLQELIDECEVQMGHRNWLTWIRSRLGLDSTPKWQELPDEDLQAPPCPLLAPCPLLEEAHEEAQECSFLLQGKVGIDGGRPRCALLTLDLSRADCNRRVEDLAGEKDQLCPHCQEPLGTHCASFLRAGTRIVVTFQDEVQDVSRLRCQECKSRWYLPKHALNSAPVTAFFALLWSGLRTLPCGHGFVSAQWELGNAVFSMQRAAAVTLELRGPAFRVETTRRSSLVSELLRTVERVEKLIEAHLAKVFKEFRALGPMGVLPKQAWFWSHEDDTLRCGLRSRSLLEASALLRKCNAQLQTWPEAHGGDSSRLVDLGSVCLLHTCLAQCRKLVAGEIIEDTEDEEEEEAFSPASAQSSPHLLKDVSFPESLGEAPSPTRRRTVAVPSRPRTDSERSSSAPPPRLRRPDEERQDIPRFGRKQSLDDSSLSLLGLTVWTEPFEFLRRFYSGARGDPRQGYGGFGTAKIPEPISVSASNEEKWATACHEPRMIFEAAGYTEPYDLDVEGGIAGVAVPLPRETFDAGALIAHALLSKTCWQELRGRLEGHCMASSEDHCCKALAGDTQHWSSFDFASLEAEDAPIKVDVRAPNGRPWSVTIYHPVRFHLLRHLTFSDDAVFSELIRHCCAHDTSGGKSNSSFWRSADGELVLKEVRPAEGEHLASVLARPLAARMAEAQRGAPSLLCEIFGFFEVRGWGRRRQEVHSIIVMRNLLHGADGWQIYDIKGVGAHRNLPPANAKEEEKAKVQWDGGFMASFSGLPVVLSKKESEELECALTQDTKVLQELGLVDYSLLMAYQEGQNGSHGRLRLGIIDFLQPYTLDKKLESTVKKLVQRHEPTIVAPVQYARRLYEFAHAAFQAAPSVPD